MSRMHRFTCKHSRCKPRPRRGFLFSGAAEESKGPAEARPSDFDALSASTARPSRLRSSCGESAPGMGYPGMRTGKRWPDADGRFLSRPFPAIPSPAPSTCRMIVAARERKGHGWVGEPCDLTGVPLEGTGGALATLPRFSTKSTVAPHEGGDGLCAPRPGVPVGRCPAEAGRLGLWPFSGRRAPRWSQAR
jgi:hypothetical protein